MIRGGRIGVDPASGEDFTAVVKISACCGSCRAWVPFDERLLSGDCLLGWPAKTGAELPLVMGPDDACDRWRPAPVLPPAFTVFVTCGRDEEERFIRVFGPRSDR